MRPAQREPIFNAPAIVVGLICVFVAVHLGRALLSQDWDSAIVDALAFNPARYGGGQDVPGDAWTAPLGFVSHTLLHGDLTHLLINSAWLLAVGTPIARRMPVPSFLAFFALCAAGGALMFLVLHPGTDVAVVGASGAISGLMAATYRLLFAAEDDRGWYLLREHTMAAPRLSVASMFTRRLPRIAIIVWVVINIAGALALGASSGQAIAWEAHLGGFFVGLLTFDLFDRGRAEELPA